MPYLVKSKNGTRKRGAGAMKDCTLSSLLQRLIPDIPEDNASLKIKLASSLFGFFPPRPG